MMCEEQTQSTDRSRAPMRPPSMAAKRSPSGPHSRAASTAVCGVVVDPDDQPAQPREARGLVAHAAADVEDGARTEPFAHLAVPGIVEREERVGGGARHGALAGQPGHLHALTLCEPGYPARGRSFLYLGSLAAAEGTSAAAARSWRASPLRPRRGTVVPIACIPHDRRRPRGRGGQARRHRRRSRAAPREHARLARPRRSRGGWLRAARVEHRRAVGGGRASRSRCGRRTRPVTPRCRGATGTA